MTKYASSWAIRTQFPSINGRKAPNATRPWHLWITAGLVIVGILYVFIINQTATQGYQMRELEQKIGQLEKLNKTTEIELTGYQTMDSIHSRLGENEFVPVEEIQYATAGAPSVALR